MEYRIIPVKNYFEIYDEHGKFIGSADTYSEALQDIEELKANEKHE